MQRVYPWLTAILFLAFLALGGLFLRQKTKILEIGLHRSDADRATRDQLTDLQHRLVAAKEARTKAEAQAAKLKQGGAGVAGSPPETANDNVKTLHVSDIVKDHPEFAALWAAQQRRNVLRQYGPALAALNLPSDQLAKLKDLLVERSLSEQDAQQAAEAAGLKQGTAAWRAALQQAEAPVDQEMGALVGTDGAQFAARLQNQGSAQNQVQFTYGPDFDQAGASLNSDQAHVLALAIANASYVGLSTATRPANYNQVDPDTMLTPHDNRILDAASATLSPAQLQVLKADLIEPHQQAAIMQQYGGGANSQVKFVP